MLISMEISVISQKLLLTALICPFCLAPRLCCQGGLLYHASALVGPSMAPCCGQPSWDYWSNADVSISSRHCHALSQHPPSNTHTHTITRSLFFLQSSILSAHPPPTRPLCKLSQICQMMASSLLTAPCKLLAVFLNSPLPVLITLRHLHLKEKKTKKKLPLSPTSTADSFTYCYASAFALSASFWFVCFCLPHQRRSRGHGATGTE